MKIDLEKLKELAEKPNSENDQWEIRYTLFRAAANSQTLLAMIELIQVYEAALRVYSDSNTWEAICYERKRILGE